MWKINGVSGARKVCLFTAQRIFYVVAPRVPWVACICLSDDGTHRNRWMKQPYFAATTQNAWEEEGP